MAMDRSGSRIGIFGGTFNPVHFGHLRVVEEVRQAFALDEMHLVPSARPPHKRAHDIAPAEDRLQMVRRAVRGNPHLFGCAYECRKEGPSYSVETLAWFRRRYAGAELFFILGWDAWLEIDTWYAWRELFHLADFIVISRQGRQPWREVSRERLFPIALKDVFCYESETCYRYRSGHRLHFFAATRLDISASQIRGEALAGRSLRYLVPESVRKYIEAHRLYCG
ncbi:MAG: nicotinate (nicotinamide) nucleotide adenylyltransferase [Deltaproteobacteria bacterium]|nr:nicotinate (nicotinamide) nucleotide adenylyltransferase [Deltaproteobacteria bacterium]